MCCFFLSFSRSLSNIEILNDALLINFLVANMLSLWSMAPCTFILWKPKWVHRLKTKSLFSFLKFFWFGLSIAICYTCLPIQFILLSYMLIVCWFIFSSLSKLEAKNFILTSLLAFMEQLSKCSEGSATLLIVLDFPGNGTVHNILLGIFNAM